MSIGLISMDLADPMILVQFGFVEFPTWTKALVKRTRK